MSAGTFAHLDRVLAEEGGFPVLAWLCDKTGRCLDGNDSLLTLIGSSLGQIKKASWLDWVQPQDQGLAKQAWSEDALGGHIHNARLNLNGSDNVLWDLLGTPQPDDDLRTVWLFVAAPVRNYPDDVQLAHSDQLAELRDTVDGVNLYAWYSSAFGTVCYINKKLATVFNIPEGHPIRSGDSGIGMGLATQLRFLPPIERPESLATWVRSIKTGTSHDVEFRLLDEDGSTRWFQIYAEPMMDRSGEHILCWSGYCLETDRKHRAAEELATVRQQLGDAIHIASVSEMAAAVAHEVNQPLGAIAANAHAALSWIKRDRPEIMRAQVALRRIERDSLAAISVVNRLEGLFSIESAEQARGTHEA